MDDQLIKEGWQRQFTTDIPRLSEAAGCLVEGMTSWTIYFNYIDAILGWGKSNEIFHE